MTENQRETFRIGPDSDLQAELFHEGRVAPCRIENLSAGGAKVTSDLRMPPRAQCTLGVRLGSSIRTSTSVEYVSFLMEVLDDVLPEQGPVTYRLRSMTGPGSTEYEAAAKLVFMAQRQALARETGADQASPMVSDEERRAKLRVEQQARFSKKSLRPGPGPD
ncbi:MAG: hypothetical protein JWL76_121 [Thermoleophilia bacterium]|nr:hypothetical protein [Thermoleophilia bacterium]